MKPFYIVESRKIYSYDLRFNFLEWKRNKVRWKITLLNQIIIFSK